MEGSLGLEHITKVDALDSGCDWKNNIKFSDFQNVSV
jgi:hypothetical protein